MKLSLFGEKYSGRSGIVDLMEDMGRALLLNPDMIALGGGNPARIPALEAVFQTRLQSLSRDPGQVHALLGKYQPPQGDEALLKQLADLLGSEYGWPVTARNIALTNGGQTAFFILANMLAGRHADGVQRQIQLPLTPEYIGYTDIGLEPDFFSASRPALEILDEHVFKYRVDFEALKITSRTAALCVSRPTNPTGNVLTDDEMAHLDQLARTHAVPLIIDGAYGTPFPNIIFTPVNPLWNENIILLLSLSKLGLPGARSGFIVASEELIQAYASANTILNLACGNLGPALARYLFADGDILRLSRELIMPYYRDRALQAMDWFVTELAGLPFYIHKPEGAIFLWLWFKDLPISSQQLYERLKQQGVLVIPGHNCFPGLMQDWSHTRQCLRISYAQDAQLLRKGIRLIAWEVRRVYQQG
ncbi:MAG: valine--pyruvate transaminase [Pseudomonadales bacterium]|nr:valine--pyruvate transaminase [Pseudomonadales bacterium]